MANGEGRKAWWRVTKRVEIRQGLHPIGSSSALRVNSGSQAFSKSVWTRCRDEARHREQQDAQAMAVRRSNSETMGPVPVPVYHVVPRPEAEPDRHMWRTPVLEAMYKFK